MVSIMYNPRYIFKIHRRNTFSASIYINVDLKVYGTVLLVIETGVNTGHDLKIFTDMKVSPINLLRDLKDYFLSVGILPNELPSITNDLEIGKCIQCDVGNEFKDKMTLATKHKRALLFVSLLQVYCKLRSS